MPPVCTLALDRERPSTALESRAGAGKESQIDRLYNAERRQDLPDDVALRSKTSEGEFELTARFCRVDRDATRRLPINKPRDSLHQRRWQTPDPGVKRLSPALANECPRLGKDNLDGLFRLIRTQEKIDRGVVLAHLGEQLRASLGCHQRLTATDRVQLVLKKFAKEGVVLIAGDWLGAPIDEQVLAPQLFKQVGCPRVSCEGGSHLGIDPWCEAGIEEDGLRLDR